MSFGGYYVNFFKFILETTFACLCFAGKMDKRPHFSRNFLSIFIGIVFLLLPVSYLASRFELGDYGIMTASIYILLCIASYTFLFACFQDCIWNLLFCCVSGSVIRMCAKKIFDVILVFIQSYSGHAAMFLRGKPLRYALNYLVLFLAYLTVYFCFRNIFHHGRLMTMDGKLFSIYIAMLASNLVLNNLEPVLLSVGTRYYVLLVFCEILYYILILCMQSFIFQTAQAKMEAHDLQELWRQDRQQYELMKENIEIINIMCHDLRHQLRNAGSQAQIPPQFIEEMEHSISIYDGKFQTGNQTLDVILTDKRLRCDMENIPFTCIVDGEKLQFIEHSDLISLFGNALENALECETGIPRPEDRFINLLVRQKNGFLVIRVENYFDGELCFKDGYPVTHKKDKSFHGYGLKSISRIVKKYGGTVHVSKEGNTFLLNIIFPASRLATNVALYDKSTLWTR